MDIQDIVVMGSAVKPAITPMTMQISAPEFSTMFDYNHNRRNLAKMGTQVVSWGSPKHIRDIPIISSWQGGLNHKRKGRYYSW